MVHIENVLKIVFLVVEDKLFGVLVANVILPLVVLIMALAYVVNFS